MDISDFNKVQDYLPIISATLIIDMIVICLSLSNLIKSKVLKKWYRNFNLGAVIADVLIIVIGIIITRFLYSNIFEEYSLIKFIGLAVVVQLVHDLLFSVLFNNLPSSNVIDVFKDYIKELGFPILAADAAMVIGSILLSTYFVNLSNNSNIIIFIIAVYILPYLVYSF